MAQEVVKVDEDKYAVKDTVMTLSKSGLTAELELLTTIESLSLTVVREVFKYYQSSMGANKSYSELVAARKVEISTLLVKCNEAD